MTKNVASLLCMKNCARFLIYIFIFLHNLAKNINTFFDIPSFYYLTSLTGFQWAKNSSSGLCKADQGCLRYFQS
jgi:hypothetical protein